jgi:hypothetical protein
VEHVLSTISLAVFRGSDCDQAASGSINNVIEATCGSLSWCNKLLSATWPSISKVPNSSGTPFLQLALAGTDRDDVGNASFPVADIVRHLWRKGSSRVTLASAATSTLIAKLADQNCCVFRVLYGHFKEISPDDALRSRITVLVAVAALLLAPSFRLRAFLALVLFGIPLVNDVFASIWFGVIRLKLVSRSAALVVVLQVIRYILQQRIYGSAMRNSTTRAASADVEEKRATNQWVSRVSDAIAPLISPTNVDENTSEQQQTADDVARRLDIGICRSVNRLVEQLTWIGEVDAALRPVSVAAFFTVTTVLSDRCLMQEYALLFRQVLTWSTAESSDVTSTSSAVGSLVTIIEDTICEKLVGRYSDDATGVRQSEDLLSVNRMSSPLRTSMLRKLLLELLDGVDQIQTSFLTHGVKSNTTDEDVARKLRRALTLWSHKGFSEAPQCSSRIGHEEMDQEVPAGGTSIALGDTVVHQDIPALELLEADGLAPPLRIPKPTQIDAGFVRLPTLPPHILLQRQRQAESLELTS